MSNPRRVRPIVICVFLHQGRILVQDIYDPTKDERFYRPAGGGIEFGEPSEAALRREMREELGVEIESPVLLGVLENIFCFDGRPGHEIVFVFDAQFVDKQLYQVDRFTISEDTGETFDAVWVELSTRGSQSPPVYPDGLVEMVQGRSGK
jgi:8-oxo-dGTP pyrophosphatase MutT (NUDIX family)